MGKRDFDKCPISRRACINCSLYRGRHFNLCFQEHYRGDGAKGTGPVKCMGSVAVTRVVKCVAIVAECA
ncbi:MAG: hypothetical protein LBT74_04365 [Acidobacteriota bacterium]|nr:hypothetical protein [Acidobacteriota bacterium]